MMGAIFTGGKGVSWRLMGEGCIDLRGIRGMVEGAGFDGMIEVEVFSNRWWEKPTDECLEAIKHAYLNHT